jgi:cell division septum initiation protein DivIVA
MDSTETALIRRLREADVPRAMRGLQEEATRKLLDQAATALHRIGIERDTLRREAEAAGAAANEDDGRDAEAIGRALVTATSISDQLVASATEKAELLVSQAQTEADTLLTEARSVVAELERETAARRAAADGVLAQAHAEGDRIREKAEADRDALLTKALDDAERTVSDAALRIEHLRAEADGLGTFLDAQKRTFVELAEATLAKLDELAAARVPGSPAAGDELLDDLHPADSASGTEASPAGDIAPAS